MAWHSDEDEIDDYSFRPTWRDWAAAIALAVLGAALCFLFF